MRTFSRRVCESSQSVLTRADVGCQRRVDRTSRGGAKNQLRALTGNADEVNHAVALGANVGHRAWPLVELLIGHALACASSWPFSARSSDGRQRNDADFSSRCGILHVCRGRRSTKKPTKWPFVGEIPTRD